LERRLEELHLEHQEEEIEPTRASKQRTAGGPSASAGTLNGSKSKGPAAPGHPSVWSTAVAALNSERSALRLKAVLLEVRAGDLPRWNRSAVEKKRADMAGGVEPSMAHLKRTLKVTSDKPLPSWTKSELGSTTMGREPTSSSLVSHLVSPLVRRPGEAGYVPPGVGVRNEVPSFSFGPDVRNGDASRQWVPKTLPKQPGSNGGMTPPKVRPLPKPRRGFGIRFDDTDD